MESGASLMFEPCEKNSGKALPSPTFSGVRAVLQAKVHDLASGRIGPGWRGERGDIPQMSLLCA